LIVKLKWLKSLLSGLVDYWDLAVAAKRSSEVKLGIEPTISFEAIKKELKI